VTDLQHSDRNGTTPETYRIELIRKSIHFSSIAIPIIYFYTPRGFALAVLFPMTAMILIIDVARYYHQPTKFWFNRTFGRLLRQHEKDRNRKRLNGATYVLLAATLAVFIFPKIIAVTSFIILILSDTTAALVGRRFGNIPLFNKSLEGTIAFFLSAICVIALMPKIEYRVSEYLIGILAAAVGALTEALPIDVDDNLSVPLIVGFVLWAGYALVLPTVDIYKFG